MEKITIQRVNSKPTSNENIKIGILSGDKWFNYFPPRGYNKEGIQNYLKEGVTIEAEVSQDNWGWKINTFVGEIEFSQGGTPSPQNFSQPSQPSQPQETPEKIEVPQQVKEEFATDTEDVFGEINTIVQLLEKDAGTLNEEVLSTQELKISAFNIRLAQLLQQADKKWRDAELDYKQNMHSEIETLLTSGTENLTKTRAKEIAESKFQEKKADLIIWQNKKECYERVFDGITNLVFAIKERIKVKSRI